MTTPAPRRLSTLEDALLGTTWRDIPFLVPGALLALAFAVASELLAATIGVRVMRLEKSPISATMIAIVLGLLVRNTIGVAKPFRAGLNLTIKKLLRLGIILLGIRLSLVDVLKISLASLPVIVVVAGLTLFLAWELARRMHLPERLGILTAVGTSICGASAIVATAPCIEASEEETSYAVANITLWGLLAMLLYPFLARWLYGGAALPAGLFLGTTIHETPQVTGAALMYNAQAPASALGGVRGGDVALIVKLVRNGLMTVAIPLVSLLYARRSAKASTAAHGGLWRYFPTFVFGFLALSLVRTVGDATLSASGRAIWVLAKSPWSQLTTAISETAKWLMTAAMASVGLNTSYQVLKGMGVKPLLLGAAAAAIVAVSALVLIALVGPLLG